MAFCLFNDRDGFSDGDSLVCQEVFGFSLSDFMLEILVTESLDELPFRLIELHSLYSFWNTSQGSFPGILQASDIGFREQQCHLKSPRLREGLEERSSPFANGCSQWVCRKTSSGFPTQKQMRLAPSLLGFDPIAAVVLGSVKSLVGHLDVLVFGFFNIQMS